ncbi:MAG: ABC transporter ATP-binding protein [bacterium]
MKNEAQHVIEIDQLTKRFGSIYAVDAISFHVNHGELFGFLGPNGAGKTTTIRMLTGLLSPDSGDVRIDGIDITKHPIQGKLKMGVIPEMGNIYIDLTARQNITMAGRFYGIPRRQLDEKTDSLLQRFKLDDRKDNPVKTFSKGMQQRVNIASALVHDPEILFLDEPTSGLDVQSQRLIKNIIKEMNQKGTTIFLTTHNIEEANILCERLAIIDRGRIATIDTPERLRRTFQSTQSVEIAFDRPVDEHWIEKEGLTGTIEKMGDKRKIYTDDPDTLVKYLVGLARDRDLKIISLEICRASLEDVFLKLTGGDSHEH